MCWFFFFLNSPNHLDVLQARLDVRFRFKSEAPLPLVEKEGKGSCWPLFIAHLWTCDHSYFWWVVGSDTELKLAPTCRPSDPSQNGQTKSQTTGWMVGSVIGNTGPAAVYQCPSEIWISLTWICVEVNVSYCLLHGF